LYGVKLGRSVPPEWPVASNRTAPRPRHTNDTDSHCV